MEDHNGYPSSTSMLTKQQVEEQLKIDQRESRNEKTKHHDQMEQLIRTCVQAATHWNNANDFVWNTRVKSLLQENHRRRKPEKETAQRERNGKKSTANSSLY